MCASQMIHRKPQLPTQWDSAGKLPGHINTSSSGEVSSGRFTNTLEARAKKKALLTSKRAAKITMNNSDGAELAQINIAPVNNQRVWMTNRSVVNYSAGRYLPVGKSQTFRNLSSADQPELPGEQSGGTPQCYSWGKNIPHHLQGKTKDSGYKIHRCTL